ncbi:hypothetical protein [Chryseobacterium sp. NKUCC03_KSP]|uniref:hypothetical protein n=1 Tax=Chryseobacterium sp. NKUCC03_KSP TaxID=2842125 RepID=UPI001C5B09BF|nr:hypothetical protein [Chryseobacterium sp. NKUCC03_KSP]MBW3523076.1 hypothetical protein [Chryseobacterium sp. NKUCC03_KSP]MBW3523083.1 hypothetical protein [Chryseobacterium sp. NKUCC03_KSP]
MNSGFSVRFSIFSIVGAICCSEISSDALLNDETVSIKDKDLLKKLKAIQELDSDTKAHIFATIDAFIKASKLKNIAAL